jgi:hypothetical protein
VISSSAFVGEAGRIRRLNRRGSAARSSPARVAGLCSSPETDAARSCLARRATYAAAERCSYVFSGDA